MDVRWNPSDTPGERNMTGSKSSKRALALGTAVLGACNSGAAPGASPSDPGSGDASDAASAALPLSTGTPTTVSSAPPVTALPAAPAVPVRHLADRRESYAYLDRAYYQEDAVEDAPPDYSFEDDGVRPWAWTTDDGSRVITEPVAGGYRYYYYQAGSDSPYMVRDPRYSYAYDNGALVSVFTPAGVQVNLDSGSEPVIYAGRYLERGNHLYRAASQQPHQAVNAYAWNDRRGDLAAQRVAWHQQVSGNPDWAAWNEAHHDEEARQWSNDRAQHQAAAQQFGAWQQQHFQGPPPQLYNQQNDHGTGHVAAVVGGVVAAGAAAVGIHALTSHGQQHDQPHAQPAPGMAPQRPGNGEPGRAEPGYHGAAPQPGNRPAGATDQPHYGQAPHQAPRQAVQTTHAAPPHYAGPARDTMQPVHTAAPHYAGPPREAVQPARAAPHEPAHAMAPHDMHPAAPHEAASPHEAPHQAPAAHPEAPHPAPQSHEHGPHADH
jgi:hypothetical protein